MYRSSSNVLVFAKTESKVTATSIATTIFTSVVDKNGKQVSPVNKDLVVDNAKSSGTASVSSTQNGGYKFTNVTILYSALFNNKTTVYKQQNYKY